MFATQQDLGNGILLGSGREGTGSRYWPLSGDTGTQATGLRGHHSEEDRGQAAGFKPDQV